MARFLTLLTLTLFFSPFTQMAQAQDFTAAQKEQINEIIKNYILDNGETIINSVENFQTAEEEKAAAEANSKAKEFTATLSKSDRPRAGNPKGDITLVEFFDYNCGYCRKALEELVVVLEKDKNVNVIFFDMPILGPASMEASQWSLAAHKQDKYFEYHQALLEHNGQKDKKTLEKIAKEIGLDVDKMKKDKDSREVVETLVDNLSKAQGMNVRGTPGFIINGEIYPGYMPADRILDIIKEQRKG